MTNDEEYELKFRDQCAIAVMSELIQLSKGNVELYAGGHGEIIQLSMDRVAKVAYKFADAMRKARLQSFI